MRTSDLRTPEQEQAAYSGLKTSDVAARLNCTEAHVIDLIRTGRLRAINIGLGKRREYRVWQEWLDAFERASVVEPDAA